jgi:hypothetical protein
MKTKSIILLVAIVLTAGLCSCTKRVTCEGVLVSGHGVPMPGERVYLYFYGTASSYPSGGTSCITDKDGRFYFNESIRKKFPMELNCRTDSGYVRKSLGKPRDQTEFHEVLIVHW